MSGEYTIATAPSSSNQSEKALPAFQKYSVELVSFRRPRKSVSEYIVPIYSMIPECNNSLYSNSMEVRYANAQEIDSWNSRILANPDGGNLLQGEEFAEI